MPNQNESEVLDKILSQILMKHHGDISKQDDDAIAEAIEEILFALSKLGYVKKEFCQCKDKPVRLISHCRNCKKEIENPPTVKEMLEDNEEYVKKSEVRLDIIELSETILRAHHTKICRQDVASRIANAVASNPEVIKYGE